MRRASDADRDAAAGALADAVAAGRLSLAEHNTRLDALFAAVTEDQVSAVVADLPARPVRRTARSAGPPCTGRPTLTGAWSSAGPRSG